MADVDSLHRHGSKMPYLAHDVVDFDQDRLNELVTRRGT